MTNQQSAGERPAWVDNELFPFESRFAEIAGNIVHYIDEGSGPILLMLHGNPTWSFVYREVIGSLRDQFRCVTLDFPHPRAKWRITEPLCLRPIADTEALSFPARSLAATSFSPRSRAT